MNPNIWIDIDNSPHVPLFRPIMEEFRRSGVEYTVTAREFAQTKDLLEFWQVPHIMVGQHAGKSKLKKIYNLVQRASKLAKTIRPFHPSLALNAGSRTSSVAGWRLGIPVAMIMDYEGAEPFIRNLFADHILLPVHIPEARLRERKFPLNRVIRFNGFKEEIYLKDFIPELDFRRKIGVEPGTVLVTLRPPSISSNYHDHGSEVLFRECLEHFSSFKDVFCLITNRTSAERGLMPDHIAKLPNVAYLQEAVDGLQLIWQSDLFISGGGTMNRESGLLGVPTYSIFTGTRPAMDEYLRDHGKLTFLETASAVRTVDPVKRPIGVTFQPTNTRLAAEISEILSPFLEGVDRKENFNSFRPLIGVKNDIL